MQKVKVSKPFNPRSVMRVRMEQLSVLIIGYQNSVPISDLSAIFIALGAQLGSVGLHSCCRTNLTLFTEPGCI